MANDDVNHGEIKQFVDSMFRDSSALHSSKQLDSDEPASSGWHRQKEHRPRRIRSTQEKAMKQRSAAK